MSQQFNDRLFSTYMEPLMAGRRNACRQLVQDALRSGTEPHEIYRNVLWPAMERIDRLFRDDQINSAVENMATRINRIVADQVQPFLPVGLSNGKRILITCANGEHEELGAQMCSDLFEAEGWDVFFLGGGVPQDEVIQMVGQLRPDLLLIFGSRPADAPLVRVLIDLIRNLNACPAMNILVSGGVFNRAEGLWREVKADLFAETALEALAIASNAATPSHEPRDPAAPKKRRRRRKPALLMTPGDEE